MNAYELADELSWSELDTDEIETWTKEAVFMLRQQANRIAELEKDGKVCATCGGLVYDPVLIQKGEPVGTVIEIEEVYGHTFKKRKSKTVQWSKKVDVGTLLYATPQDQQDRIAELEKEADRLSDHANELRKIHADRIAELEKDLEGCEYFLNKDKSGNSISAKEYQKTHEGFSTIIDKATFPRWSKEQDLINSWKDIGSTPQTKPLSDEPSVKEITDLWLDVVNNRPANDKRPIEWHFARAIEAKVRGEK